LGADLGLVRAQHPRALGERPAGEGLGVVAMAARTVAQAGRVERDGGSNGRPWSSR
jgi:hypothetical protein